VAFLVRICYDAIGYQPNQPIALSNVVYKDKDEAAVRWELKPTFYSKSEDRILTIINQARCVINNPERKLAYKVGYLEESLKSIEESITQKEDF
jgi:hypothetical protein